MQILIFVFSIFLTTLAVSHVRAVTFSNAGFLGWNELLQTKGIFEDEENFIKSKSYEDSILLSEFTDLLTQENILENAYSNYKRVFDTDKFEANERDRLDFFKNQLFDIASHNLEARSGKHTWTKGVNQFTHMTNDEFESISSVNMAAFADSLGISNVSQYESKTWTSLKEAPSSMNWVDTGVVTPVKNQNRCNSCVMFASTAQLESVTALSRKTQPVSYSPQELVDCAVPSFTCKSEGSDPADIFKYLKSEGVSTWDSYPYQLPPSKGECRRDAGQSQSRAGKIQEYTGYQDISEDELKELLVSDGPIFVAIKTYGGYGAGIYDGAECGNTTANHAVLLVGYGEENGVQFWRIKNSYGSNWGEDGYLRLRRNNGNVCQIAKSIVVSITAA